ncbi:acetyltransferase [Wenjunlia vitaminophila]|uniref:Acetyltransferase n=1 Tax=Wenjunlia vitaminophila TaxID=76728 RepID=A0A0T6LPH3_WENVI|nr:GNAT family N-acetyltransferase [Wenjunlia vitaminophila]KRV48011.1 acetyltransferase [Wenjunlia vitaminophila]
MNVISLGYRTDLMVLASAGSVIVDRPSHLVVRTPSNPDFWWGNFVLFDAPPGPGDAERWSAVFAREFPEAEHLALGVDGTRGDAGDAGERARLGTTTEVDSVLTASRLVPPSRPAPEDLQIRPLSGDDDWEQAVRLRFDCDELGLTVEHRTFLERRVADHRRLCEAGHGVWFGAFTEGRMRAGTGVFGAGDGLARFQNVETHPAFRRRGLASALVHHAGLWGLRELGARMLVIVADPGYHAIDVYRRLGFADAEHQVRLCRAPAPTRSD